MAISLGFLIRHCVCSLVAMAFAKPDHEVVWQAGDGKQGIASKSLMDADFIGTAGGRDGDASGTDGDDVLSTVFAGDGKTLFFRHLI